MRKKIQFFLNHLQEQLWVKPLLVCLFSILIVYLAKVMDYTDIHQFLPNISVDSIKPLLSIISTSMLVIATFSVASMLAGYTSASNSATPRSFPLVIGDDVSQNALSVFIGAFIFSVVARIAIENFTYGRAGRFALFVLTLLFFAVVILTFIRWVDRIARLGRLRTTIQQVEATTTSAFKQRRHAKRLGGVPIKKDCQPQGWKIYAETIGYVQQIEMDTLQKLAKKFELHIEVAVLPGAFIGPERVIAYVSPDSASEKIEATDIAEAFMIDVDRTFDEDPRLGLIALSEIGSRALSPAINDPGTAIEVIGSFVRLFALWGKPVEDNDTPTIEYDRVAVPEISLEDMFDDAFTGISRDGAGTIEVVIRLLKALNSLASIQDPFIRDAAVRQSKLVLARAEKALTLQEDLIAARKIALSQNSQEGFRPNRKIG